MLKQSLRACAIVLSVAVLSACATTGERRVVKVAPTATVTASNVNYASLEASAACETRAMRKRVLDDDPSNDIASITVQRELSPGRRTETDLDVNCRDYFARQLGGATAQPRMIRAASEPTIIVRPATPVAAETPAVIEVRTEPARMSVHSGPARTIRVKRGDTLYGLAREHCTGWKTLARENGLRDASRISPGDVLYLPAGAC